jgi:hypothetical protein
MRNLFFFYAQKKHKSLQAYLQTLCFLASSKPVADASLSGTAGFSTIFFPGSRRSTTNLSIFLNVAASRELISISTHEEVEEEENVADSNKEKRSANCDSGSAEIFLSNTSASSRLSGLIW